MNETQTRMNRAVTKQDELAQSLLQFGNQYQVILQISSDQESHLEMKNARFPSPCYVSRICNVGLFVFTRLLTGHAIHRGDQFMQCDNSQERAEELRIRFLHCVILIAERSEAAAEVVANPSLGCDAFLLSAVHILQLRLESYLIKLLFIFGGL